MLRCTDIYYDDYYPFVVNNRILSELVVLLYAYFLILLFRKLYAINRYKISHNFKAGGRKYLGQVS